MRPALVSLALLLVCTLALAAESADPNAPWQPKKGDTVYVSAELVLVIPWLFDHQESTIPACVPSSVQRADSQRQIWKLKPPNARGIMSVGLRGPWLPRLHSTEQECHAFYESEGQPPIVRRSSIHEIVPPGSK